MSRSPRISVPRRLLALAAFGLAMASANVHAAPLCPSAIVNQPKGNQLFLYFATSSDPTFPLYKEDEIPFGVTSPLAPFKASDLDLVSGSTTDLIYRIRDKVIDHYCEFNVNVTATTFMPSPSAARWQIVGLGTDWASFGGTDYIYGVAQETDMNDSNPQSYVRVFARSLKDKFFAFNGSGSTLERWATGISGVATHEAAHGYGANHSDAQPRPNSAEDDASWHMMATGGTLDGEIRAGRDRHFSDTEYEILGHNVGLSTKTLHNWDFVNPNDTSADGLRLKLLSNAASLSLNDWYHGPSSPWDNPTVTPTGAVQMFQGTSYKVFHLDFTTAKSWNGPTPGVVEPAADFHTGATFAGDDPVIVFDVELLSGGVPLPLAPRLPGYNAGSFEMKSGKFKLDFFNMDPSAGELVLSDVLVFRAPRMLDIGAMMRDARPVDPHGVPVEFQSRTSFERLELRDRAELPLGQLTDRRSVDVVYGPEDCPQRGGRARGSADSEMAGGICDCPQGTALSLFPATYTYVIATVVEPNARYWDPARRTFVTGPLRSILYYQIAGTVPDFNRNGVDDLLDIRNGTSRDKDRNGVPDDMP